MFIMWHWCINVLSVCLSLQYLVCLLYLCCIPSLWQINTDKWTKTLGAQILLPQPKLRVSIQLAPAWDFWPLKSRQRHFPNLNPKTNLQNTLEKTLKNVKKIIIAWEWNLRPMQCNLYTLPLSHGGNRPGGNFRSFNLYGKGKSAK